MTNKRFLTQKKPKTERFFATCPKGLEQLLEEEIQQLGAESTKQTVAGVTFFGPIELAYKVCLWSRLANRILYPIGFFAITNADDLYQSAAKISWQEHMSVTSSFIVDFSGVSEALNHTQFSAQKVKDAIVDQFRQKVGKRPSVDKKNPMLRINVVFRKGKATFSIDLSGDSLHRRGYRLEGGAAPLKENLAAGILIRSKWLEISKKGGALVDPMCGSGTLLIEGMMMAADIAPNLKRETFGFHGWRLHKEKIWQDLLLDANERANKGRLNFNNRIYGFDISAKIINHCNANIRRADLARYITVQTADVSQLSTVNITQTFGLCVCNPPYGERLNEAKDLLPLYRMLSDKLKSYFLNWEAALFTGNPELSRNMGLRAYKKYPMFNGAIPCLLLLFHITPEWFIYHSNELPK